MLVVGLHPTAKRAAYQIVAELNDSPELVEVSGELDEAVREALDTHAERAVLCLVANEQAVLSALAAGADEAIVAAKLSAETLASAIARARASAAGRRLQAVRCSARATSSEVALSDSIGWLGHQLNTPLSTALLDAELLVRVLPKVGNACTLLLDRTRQAGALSPLELRQVLPESAMTSMRDAEEVAVGLLEWVSRVRDTSRDLKSISDLFRGGSPERVDVHEMLGQVRRFVARELDGGPGLIRQLDADRVHVVAPKPQLAALLSTAFGCTARLAREVGTPLKLATREDGDRLLVEWRVTGAPGGVADEALVVATESARQLGGELKIAVGDVETTLELVLPVAD